MYKRIYFDKKHNKIYLWESDNGKTSIIEDYPDIEYYIDDPQGTSEIKNIYGIPQVKKVANSYYKLKDIKESGLKTCEAFFSQEIKYLQQQYAGKQLICNISDFQIATVDIETEAKHKIDTVNTPDIINLITVHFSKEDEYYTFGLKDYTGSEKTNYYYCANENILLSNFIKVFKSKKVDIITGWNIDNFDIPYIINRCNKLEVRNLLSPLNIYVPKTIKSKFGKDVESYRIAGLNILDGQRLFEKFNREKLPSYSLNSVGMYEFKEGKFDKEGQILSIYETNWNDFVDYNIQDVRLAKKINHKKKFINLSIQLCYDSLIPIENCFSAISLGTGDMLAEAHKSGIVLNDIDQNAVKTFFPGAITYAKSGLYKYVVSYDFTSMYPHLIMQFNISPETLRYKPKDTLGLIRTPVSERYACETQKGHFETSGIYYDGSIQGFLPKIIAKKFQERKLFNTKLKICKMINKNINVETIAKNLDMELEKCSKLYDEVKSEGFSEEYYDMKQYSLKILINSYFGTLANPHFCMFNMQNAIAVTCGGRELISLVVSRVNDYFKTTWNQEFSKYFPNCKLENVVNEDIVILCDTDSSYFNLEPIVNSIGLSFKSNNEFLEFTVYLDKLLFKPFFEVILQEYADKYGTKQLMNFKREKIMSAMMIIKKKNYANLVLDSEGIRFDVPKLSVTGLTIVKSSSPVFARQKLEDVLKCLIESNSKLAVIKMLKTIKKEFETQDIENISFFKKVNDISKWKTDKGFKLKTPQHVKAALNYNRIIENYGLKLQPITNGNHIKFIKVYPQNELNADVMAYVGKFPEVLRKKFKLHTEQQWYIAFIKEMERYFKALNWGKVDLNQVKKCLDF